MTAKYFALLTQVGAAKLANATALGTPLAITDMVVGDANGTDPTPDPTQTALVHECHRAPLNSLRVDPDNSNQVIAEQVLAETVGGWWVREIGLVDADGDLIAVGNCPPSYKPQMEEGSGREQIIRMVLIVSSTDAVVLKIDPSVVLATREYVDDAIEAHAKSRNHPDATLKEKGLVQLSSATDSISETLAATPKAVKAAFDNAADKVAKAGDTMTGPLGIKSTVTVYEDDVNTVSEFLYAYKEAGQQTKKVGIKAICDADGAGHWVVDVNPAAQGDSRVQAFGIDGKSKIVTTMNGFQLYEGTERVFSKNNPQLMFGVGMGPVDKADAYSNIGQIYRVNATAKNKPPAVTGNVSAGVMCLPMDAAPSAGYFAVVGGNMAAYVGFSQNTGDSITWSRIYTDKFKPTAVDMNALPLTGGTMTGEIQSTSANYLRAIQGGYGSIWRMDENNTYFLLTNQGDPTGNFNDLRPLTINNNTGNVDISTALSVGSVNSIYKTGIHDYSDGGGSYHQTNGMTLQGVGDQVGEMYFLENIGKYALVGLHARSGGRDAWYEFRHDGNIFANGTNVAPVGVIEAWPSDTPPTGWLICNGTGFNTGAFPNLALIFPSGQLPDLRGAFLRGKDNGKGVDPNRGLLSIQPGQAPASAIGGGEWGNYAGRDTGHTVGTGTDNTGTYRVMQETEQQRETRPYNVAINYIVRAA
ncbi:phage tail-collar fiber domain-containing protein [Serratia marcescens]|uniref:phage tail-collar fiber domain-containing protein n=1 Tax=Serratia marcescens TaxID=615 RepID=UPI0040452544